MTGFHEFGNIFEKKIFVDKEYEGIEFNDNKELEFDDNEELNLKYLFEFLNATLWCTWKSSRHSFMLQIENKFIQSTQFDILGEIHFDQIRWRRCFNLKTIHYNAFGRQAKNINHFSFHINCQI